MENIQEGITLISSIITSVITVGTVIYKIGFKSDRKREKKYYEKVLQPFVKAISQDSNVNILKFIKRITTRTNDYVPKYIFYLVDQKKSEDLKKVLLYDYFDIYENDVNMIGYIFRVGQKILTYCLVFAGVLWLYAGCLSILAGTSELVLLVSNNVFGNIIKNKMELSGSEQSFGEIGKGIVFIFFSYLTVVFFKRMNMDRYKIGRIQIEKTIKKYVAYYDKYAKHYIY